ncbi:phosphotransferase [Geitlerinema sp. CS-897]|nr:phosphotransferase [Geitlerinema sp. CS-897]
MVNYKFEYAWSSGDLPGEPKFHYPVPQSISKPIVTGLKSLIPNIDFLELFSLQQAHALSGRFIAKSKSSTWLLRVTERLGYSELEKKILDYALSQGISLSPILYSEIIKVDGKYYRVDVRPFIHGDHFDGSTKKIYLLAKELSKLHKGLADFPDRNRIQIISRQRYQALEETRKLLGEAITNNCLEIFGSTEAWVRKNMNWLQLLVTMFDPRMDLRPSAQCLHGEVHPGNVLFQEGYPILIDFEESVHTFAPPDWDLAFLVQRFCMNRKTGELDRNLFKAVTDGYGTSLPPLSMTMRQAAWFSVAVALQSIRNGLIVPNSELDKFVLFEEFARSIEQE